MNPIHLAVLRIGDLLAAGPAGSDINVPNIIGFLASRVLPVLIAVFGTWAVSRATRGETSKLVTGAGILVAGLVVIGSAGLLAVFGDSMAHKIFG